MSKGNSLTHYKINKALTRANVPTFNRKRQYTASDIKNPTPYQIVDLILYKVLRQPFLPEVTIKTTSTSYGRNATDRCPRCWSGFDLKRFPLL